jgi:Rrf2 family nitric oxide-sensitive transcriptional repressor
MHINRYTDYSLRVLLYLAIKGDQLSTINEIAQSYGISKNHLMKIVQQLSAKGYLLAIRGKHGGIRLNRPASEINVGALVRDIEDRNKLVECFGEKNQCIITPSCALKHMFAKAQESFFKTLDRYKLSDLLSDNKANELAEILTIQLQS